MVIKVWITKYALTDGIMEKKVEECGDGMCNTVEDEYTAYYHGRDWHRTRESAVKRAEEMRVAKIKSMEKRIAKLKNLKF